MAKYQYQPTSRIAKTPFKQISFATWPAVLGVVAATALIIVVCLTTNGKPTNNSVWTRNAAVFVAVGGIVLRGSLASLFGIALYHRLWLLLGRHHDNPGDKPSNSGLTVKEIESHHLASRLAIGMLFEPSNSIAWLCGLLGLLVTSAIVPTLQYGMDMVPSSTIRPTTVDLQHAQLDDRMALKSGAAGYPDNVAPNVLRASTVALFGADSAFVYSKENVSGIATFSDVQYADVECNIDVVSGQVEPTSKGRSETTYPCLADPPKSDYYYNFTHDYITAQSSSGSEYNFYQSLQFTSTLNNNTHYLNHHCHIRPAIGTCSIRLTNGTGLMRHLNCIRSTWMTQDQLPDSPTSPAIGFFAVTVAFIDLFEGAAWTSSQQGRPQQNSTFVQATSRYFDRLTIGMPTDLLSHVQRTLWHTAINARPVNLPASEIGGQYDLNSTVNMLVQDETPILLVKVDYLTITSVLAVCAVLCAAALAYLIVATNIVPGRLMRDSLVHTLSVPVRRDNGSVGASSALCLPDESVDGSLENVMKAGRDIRLRCAAFGGDSGSWYLNGGNCGLVVLEQVPRVSREEEAFLQRQQRC